MYTSIASHNKGGILGLKMAQKLVKQSASVPAAALALTILLGIEINYLLQIEAQQRRGIVVQEPQHVLEQNGVHVHEDHPSSQITDLPSRHRFHHKPKRVFLKNKRLNQKHPLLFSHDHRHGTVGFVEAVMGEGPIA